MRSADHLCNASVTAVCGRTLPVLVILCVRLNYKYKLFEAWDVNELAAPADPSRHETLH